MFVSKARLNTHIYEILSNIHVIKRIRWKKAKKLIFLCGYVIRQIGLICTISSSLRMYNISWTCFLAALWICVLYNFHFFLPSSENYIPFIEYSWRGEKSKRFIHPNWIKEKWNKSTGVHNKFLFYLYCLCKYLLDNLYQHISCFICRLLFVSPSVPVQKVYVWSKWISR